MSWSDVCSGNRWQHHDDVCRGPLLSSLCFHDVTLYLVAAQMMRYLASAALPPGQAINEELIANIAPLLDQVGSVFGEVRDALMCWLQSLQQTNDAAVDIHIAAHACHVLQAFHQV